MKITLDMSISQLLEEFDREFGLSLSIYRGATKSDDISLYEIADIRKDLDSFIIVDKDTSVETLESMFRQNFGIKVLVKDKDGNTLNQNRTLSGSRVLIDDDDVQKTEEDITIKKTSKIKQKKEKNDTTNKKNTPQKGYYLKPDLQKHSVEDKIKEIDRYYFIFQRSETYKPMINLISCIEEAYLLYPHSSEIINHIEDIKLKSVNVSNLSIRKRRFAVLLLIILTSIFSIIGIGVWGYDFYKSIQRERLVDSIVKEIDNLRLQKGALVESGSLAEANAIDENINSKSIQLNNLKNTKGHIIVYYSILLAFIMLVILFIFLNRLNRYNVTSYRFYKNN